MIFTFHTQVINYVISKYNLQSYLELGTHRPEANFNLIRCRYKISVDPSTVFGQPSFVGTSDEFFEQNKQTFDCIFIDGLHHADQVQKDFANSLNCLNEGGIILIHDTNPQDEKYTPVPRNGLKGRWNGDVWKFVADDLWKHPVEWKTLDFEANGLTVVRKPSSFIPVNLGLKGERNWQFFTENKEFILHTCTTKEFIEWV